MNLLEGRNCNMEFRGFVTVHAEGNGIRKVDQKLRGIFYYHYSASVSLRDPANGKQTFVNTRASGTNTLMIRI